MASRLLQGLASMAPFVSLVMRQHRRSTMSVGRLLNVTAPASLAAAASSVVAAAAAAMSGFNLLHLVSKSQPVKLKACGLPSGTSKCMLLRTCRTKKTWPKTFSQDELRKQLTPMQFHVTQEKGTESLLS
ncbi:hypothetical protein NFI96_025732 [Prochilodus magdalenae]|nr:hypothetical protein NFI96_025732 [Prochilodus magdalenae]